LIDVRIAHGTYWMDEFFLFFGAKHKLFHITIINLTLPARDFFTGIIFRFEILTHVTLKDIIIFSFDCNFLNRSILSQAHPVDWDFTIYTIY
jgi:hypothetical protein